MQKREKIGIAILVILTIILVANLWSAKANNPRAKINCDTFCRQIGNGSWFFPGSSRVAPEGFYTKEECTFACQKMFKK